MRLGVYGHCQLIFYRKAFHTVTVFVFRPIGSLVQVVAQVNYVKRSSFDFITPLEFSSLALQI